MARTQFYAQIFLYITDYVLHDVAKNIFVPNTMYIFEFSGGQGNIIRL